MLSRNVNAQSAYVGCDYQFDTMRRSQPKYAKKADLNQAEIVDALRKAGISVEIIGEPLDLLCGHNAINILLEIKRPGQKPRTKKQKLFLKNWKGQARIVETAEDAIDVVFKITRKGW